MVIVAPAGTFRGVVPGVHGGESVTAGQTDPAGWLGAIVPSICVELHAPPPQVIVPTA
jgi:hypothetical protein